MNVGMRLLGCVGLAVLVGVVGCKNPRKNTGELPPQTVYGPEDTVGGLDSSAPVDAVVPQTGDTGPDATLPTDATATGGDAATPDVSGADTSGDAVAPPPSGATAFPWSTESTDEACKDGKDNDDNGYADCDDFACSRNLAVFVCGAASHYENSPDACADGKDNDGDKLVDCKDPDCFKNPFHDVCDQPLSETGCADGQDADGDGLVGCDDLDCVLLEDGCSAKGKTKVLFDQSVDETSASGPNSDWVVDSFGRLPTPSNPASADDWSGALSSFGHALHTSGYLVESLTSWEGHLSYGDTTNPQDLSHYDVLAMVEPSRQMTSEEKKAVIDFVVDGGSLLAVANHVGADRDGNGFSAPQVWNDMFENNPVAADPFGFGFDEIDVDTGAPLSRIESPTHAVIDGPAGKVTKIGFYQGCTVHLTGTNPNITPLVLLDDAKDSSSGIVAGAAVVGLGKVFFLTDSAIAGDGSDSHGNDDPAHDSWHDPAQDNATLLLNAMAWLAIQ